MKHPYVTCLAAAAISLISAYAGEDNAPAPARAGDLERTTVKGMITGVQITPGGGPPTLTIQDDAGVKWTILLGAIHYLIREDFRPKSGQKAEVIAIYRSGYRAMAEKVTLPETGKTIVLRDKQGYPVWLRGWGAGPPKP